MRTKTKTKTYIKNISKAAYIAILITSLIACKNISMDAMFSDYNSKFLPSEDVFWTVEFLEKSTMSFDEYELEDEYRVKEDTGLFMLGGPRDADTWTWFFDGGSIVSNKQVLELVIKKQKPNLDFTPHGSAIWNSTGSIAAGSYELILQCTKNGKPAREFRTRLVVY